MPERGAPPWLWPNLLSLDAPVVAVVWLYFYASVEGFSFRWPVYAVLFGVVWCLYIFDRLIDTARPPVAGPETCRHRFYRRFRGVAWLVLAGLAAAVAYGVLASLPARMVGFGLIASIFVLFYFAQVVAGVSRHASVLMAMTTVVLLAVVMKQFDLSPVVRLGALFLVTLVMVPALRAGSFRRIAAVPKELLCGVTFALGVFLPVVSYQQLGLFSVVGEPAFYLFAGLCALNCIGIAIDERREDAASGAPSLPSRRPGVGRLFVPACWAVAGGALAMVPVGAGYGGSQWAFYLAVGISAAALALLFSARGRLARGAFRVGADAVLLSPLLLLPFV